MAACGRPFGISEIELTPAIEIGSADGGGGTDASGPDVVDATPDVPTRVADFVDVTTQHNDGARTGANLRETCVRPANVASMREKRRQRW